MKKISLLGAMFLLVSMTLLGTIVGNDGERAYNNDDGDKGAVKSLETLIITGAGSFIQANATFQQLLNRVEMSGLNGVDYNELRRLINNTHDAIISARTAYDQLIAVASSTPYNPSFIQALETFYYLDFMRKNSLNPVIFLRLQMLLQKGNVTGVYQVIYQGILEIKELLEMVKKCVEKGLFPPIPTLWKINQAFFNTYLFGQYAAMIFNEVKEII
jgi:hypothetical protein